MAGLGELRPSHHADPPGADPSPKQAQHSGLWVIRTMAPLLWPSPAQSHLLPTAPSSSAFASAGPSAGTLAPAPGYGCLPLVISAEMSVTSSGKLSLSAGSKVVPSRMFSWLFNSKYLLVYLLRVCPPLLESELPESRACFPQCHRHPGNPHARPQQMSANERAILRQVQAQSTEAPTTLGSEVVVTE